MSDALTDGGRDGQSVGQPSLLFPSEIEKEPRNIFRRQPIAFKAENARLVAPGGGDLTQVHGLRQLVQELTVTVALLGNYNSVIGCLDSLYTLREQ